MIVNADTSVNADNVTSAARGGGSSSPRPVAPARWRWRREWTVAVGFLLPALVVYALFVIYPAIQSVSYSFYDWSGPGRPATFIGLGNYVILFGDPMFYRALTNNFVVVIVSLAFQLPLGLLLALLITSNLRFRRAFRAVYFLPTLMSTVAIGILWGYIYNPTYGAVNVVLRAIGLGDLAQGWLGQTSTALGAVMVTTIWQWAPFYMIIYAAALVAIPRHLYEAASIDGATAWSQFWHITLPLLRPVIVTTVILSLVGSIKYFDLIYVMTNGGPNGATELLATYMLKQGFATLRFGYASAVAVAMLVLALFVTLIVLVRGRRLPTDAKQTRRAA